MPKKPKKTASLPTPRSPRGVVKITPPPAPVTVDEIDDGAVKRKKGYVQVEGRLADWMDPRDPKRPVLDPVLRRAKKGKKVKVLTEDESGAGGDGMPIPD